MWPKHFEADNGSVQLPAFFASISSVKTSLSLLGYLQAAIGAGYPNILVSAYDLDGLSGTESDAVRDHLAAAIATSKSVLFDSGNYESYWLRDDKWSQSRFHSTLDRFPCSFMFSFDVRYNGESVDQMVSSIAASLDRDRRVSGGIPVVPIIHGAPSNLPAIARGVAIAGDAGMVAIAERELGGGVLERSSTLWAIRSALDASGKETAIHLLGTGNPLSIATYMLLGAGSFDGLEWCQTAVDSATGNLHHLSHGELFFDRQQYEASGLGVSAYTLIRNLEFFNEWMECLRRISLGDRDCAMCQDLFGRARKVAAVGRQKC